jgi:hypothetical protein
VEKRKWATSYPPTGIDQHGGSPGLVVVLVGVVRWISFLPIGDCVEKRIGWPVYQARGFTRSLLGHPREPGESLQGNRSHTPDDQPYSRLVDPSGGKGDKVPRPTIRQASEVHG